MSATTCLTLSNFLYVPMCGNDNPIMSLTDGDGFNWVIDVPLEMLSEIIFEIFFRNFDRWTKMPTFIPHRAFICQQFRCNFIAFFLELSEMKDGLSQKLQAIRLCSRFIIRKISFFVLPFHFRLSAVPPVCPSEFYLPVAIVHPKIVNCTAVDSPSGIKALSNRCSNPG